MKEGLPDGTRYVLPQRAAAREGIVKRLAELYDAWGYQLVEVPVLERYQADHPRASQSFKLSDRDSGVLALRSDFTPALAGLVRLDYPGSAAEGGVPLRLRYAGTVWHAIDPELSRTREFTQLGLELIGVSNARADAELITPLDGLHPLAFFDDDPELHLQRVEGLRVYGGLPDADAFAERHNVTHVIVAIPSLPNEILARLIDVRGKQFRHLQFVPKLSGIPAEDVFASNLDGMLALEIRKGLNSRANRLLKRSIDLVGGLIGGLLISPVVLALYLWVRLDSRGPGFYWSERIGENGKTFRCLKFRTMHYDADERLTEMMAKSTGIRREYRQYHKLENDPRITGAGRILRRNSLDELSQLYNVVIGDMSLVGPRPYLTREQADMGTSGEIIFQAKPGMTGYWQISGRSNVTFEDRLAMETHYVRNWSIWWDIVILVQTLPVVIRRRGAQ